MSSNWWENFYDDTFADVVMATGEDDPGAAAAAAFLVEKLQLRAGDTVFDQGCGLGRMSFPLARQGMHTLGVDLAANYIRRATEMARAVGLPCEFHVGDAFQFVPERPCDGAFNWWSSFGYAPEDARNREMLLRAFAALRPGRRFALDYYSTPRLMRDFQQTVYLRYRTRTGESEVARSATPDFSNGMIEQVWSYVAPDGKEHRKTSHTKMYMPHELRTLLESCGFVDVELYGGADGRPFTLDSARCVLVAQKP